MLILLVVLLVSCDTIGYQRIVIMNNICHHASINLQGYTYIYIYIYIYRLVAVSFPDSKVSFGNEANF